MAYHSGKRLVMSLRFALLLVLVLGAVLGRWIGQARAQRRAVEIVARAGESVAYDYEVDNGAGDLGSDAELRRVAASLRADGTVLPPRARFLPTGPPLKTSRFGDWARRVFGEDLLHNVVQVHAVHSRLTDADIAVLAELRHLEVLNLGGTPVGDVGLSRLEGLQRLRKLYVYQTRVTDTGLVHVARLGSLEHLGLARNRRITDAGLACLSHLRALRSIELGGTGITDAGLGQLRNLDHLEWIELHDLPITDKGLEYLRTLPRLKTISIGRTQVTENGLAELKKARPGLEFTR